MGAATSNESRLHRFTLNELATLRHGFRQAHKHELDAPSAATNSIIIDYNSIDSILMKYNFAYMVVGGCMVYGVQGMFGHHIETLFSKPFNGKYAQGLTALVYIVMFFSTQSQLSKRLHILDLNTKINKSPVSSLWLQVIQQHLPYKFNQKYFEIQQMRMSQYSQWPTMTQSTPAQVQPAATVPPEQKQSVYNMTSMTQTQNPVPQVRQMQSQANSPYFMVETPQAREQRTAASPYMKQQDAQTPQYQGHYQQVIEQSKQFK